MKVSLGARPDLRITLGPLPLFAPGADEADCEPPSTTGGLRVGAQGRNRCKETQTSTYYKREVCVSPAPGGRGTLTLL